MTRGVMTSVWSHEMSVLYILSLIWFFNELDKDDSEDEEDHELMSDVDTEEYYDDTTNDQLIQNILYGPSDDEEFEGF